MEEYGAYFVIKILSPNENDLFGEYKCVPKSWVKVKDIQKNYVVFGYPVEDKLCTLMRVIEHEPLDTSWPILYGEEVLNTDSQEKAFRFVERREQELKSYSDQSRDTSEQDDDDDDEVETTTTNKIIIKPNRLSSKKTNHPSKQKQSEQENVLQNNKIANHSKKGIESIFLEAYELISTHVTDDDNEETVSSSTLNYSHDTQIPDSTQILPNETDNGTDKNPVIKENAAKVMERHRRKSTRQTRNFPQSYFEFSDAEFDRSDDSDYAPDKANNLPVVVNDSLDQDINKSLLNDQVYSHCYNFYVKFNESYQNTMSLLDNCAEYLQKIMSTDKDNVAAKAIQASPSPTNEQPDAINPNLFSHPQPLLQERTSCSNEDTKWTLRYPEPGQGIVELIPHSGVYVSEKGLSKCKSTYKLTTKFTSGLLEEVFTHEALKKCSFTGFAGKKITKNPNKNIKPALDLKARETLVEYVYHYSREMGWKKANPHIIMSCIRNRLQRLYRIG